MKTTVVCAVLALAVVALGPSAARAQETGLEGRKIVVKANKAGKSKIVFLSKDAAIEGPSSPTGALLEVCSPTGGVATFDLPAENWTINKKGIAKYKLKGGTDGVKVALIKPGRTLKLVTGSAGALDLTSPLGSVGVRLTIDGSVQCALFSGDAVRKDDPGKFLGKTSPAPADCSDATLGCGAGGSPSGAFFD